MTVYYNEIDPFAAAWLRNLIAADLIAPGDVDERSIVDVRPGDLAGYRQCHFFAGIGVWSRALREAGWPDDRPAWTGSCPCQPLSSAGQRKGHVDERHLWPAFHGLIAECRPAVVLGEQVASKDGREWFAAVRADLEATGYACGAAVTPAAGYGAPHERHRLYWLAHADDAGPQGRRVGGHGADQCAAGARGVAGGLGHSECLGAGRDTGASPCAEGGAALRPERDHARPSGAVGRLADDHEGGRAVVPPARLHGEGAFGDDASRRGDDGELRDGRGAAGHIAAVKRREYDRPRPTNGLWGDADWLLCRDGRWRPVESGSFPLVDAGTYRNRVALLRGAGNAIVLPQATAFVAAAQDILYPAIEAGVMLTLTGPMKVSESREQEAFVGWFRIQFPGVLLFAIPNGSHLAGDARGRAIAMARLKREGLVPGMLDLHVPAWRLWIEMKAQHRGQLSQEQRNIIDHLRAIGHTVIVAAGCDHAVEQVRAWRAEV